MQKTKLYNHLWSLPYTCIDETLSIPHAVRVCTLKQLNGKFSVDLYVHVLR